MEPVTIAIASALASGITEVLKRTRGLNFLDGRYEITAIVIAVVISVVGGLDILQGVIAGLTALGLYDVTTRGIEGAKKLM